MRITDIMLQKVGEAECVPWGYGLVSYNACTRTTFFLPIPINIIVRFSICFYWRIVYFLYPSKFDKKLEEARHIGWNEAWKIAYEDGRKEGYKDGYEKGWYGFGDFMLAELEKPSSERYGAEANTNRG